jgi:myo-inositol-1(or 4)-monophosphatase
MDPAQVEEKAKNDVVSRADHESEAVCRRVLLGAFPSDRFLGEETGMSGANESAPAWIVDPLDGTANFVRGFPHWAVSIARTRGGLLGPLEVGVIWDPIKKDLFTAEAGAGAFRNGVRTKVRPRAGLDGAALATGFPFRQQAKIDVYLRIFREVFLKAQSLRRAGSAALDLAYVAAGIFDGFFEFGLSPWDTAAGALLIAEAGGVVTDFDGGPSWRTRGNVLAGAPGVHAALRGLVDRLGVTEGAL